MRPDHEDFFRSLDPGYRYCHICSRNLDSPLDCGKHIEKEHPGLWLKMVETSDAIEEVHATMKPIEDEIKRIRMQELLPRLEKLEELQNHLNSLLAKIPRFLEETHHVSSRN